MKKRHESLLLTLKMLDAKIVEGTTMTVPFVSKKRDAEGNVTDPGTLQELSSLLSALEQAVTAE